MSKNSSKSNVNSEIKASSEPKTDLKNWTPAASSSYIDYDLTKIKDTRAGFLIDSNADTGGTANGKNAKNQDQVKIRSGSKRVIYEHLLPQQLSSNSNLNNATGEEQPLSCCECQSINVDVSFFTHYMLQVCPSCINSHPEKYTLLTKTEAKQDYLLTDEELRDTSKLPHWDRPNPRKSTYARMKLFVRCQVESFAFEKWGGEDKLDEEFYRREDVKNKRKQAEHKKKLNDMRKRTRTSLYLERREKQQSESAVNHEHDWVQLDGSCVKTCKICKISLEEEEF